MDEFSTALLCHQDPPANPSGGTYETIWQNLKVFLLVTLIKTKKKEGSFRDHQVVLLIFFRFKKA